MGKDVDTGAFPDFIRSLYDRFQIDVGNKIREKDVYKRQVLYFYSKDNTAGCTKQACGFSERYPQFIEKGAVILGVSKDSVSSHKRFEEKYGLAFTLLADPERKVIEAYDVWKEKKNYGKVSMGVVRTTYLIDEQDVYKRQQHHLWQ